MRNYNKQNLEKTEETYELYKRMELQKRPYLIRLSRYNQGIEGNDFTKMKETIGLPLHLWQILIKLNLIKLKLKYKKCYVRKITNRKLTCSWMQKIDKQWELIDNMERKQERYHLLPEDQIGLGQ